MPLRTTNADKINMRLYIENTMYLSRNNLPHIIWEQLDPWQVVPIYDFAFYSLIVISSLFSSSSGVSCLWITSVKTMFSHVISQLFPDQQGNIDFITPGASGNGYMSHVMKKTNTVVSEQVQHKPSCTSTENG